MPSNLTDQGPITESEPLDWAYLNTIRARVECHGEDCECYEHQPGTPPHELKALLEQLQGQLAAVAKVADRIEPHANNMAAIGELEVSVPLKAAVRDIRAALGLGKKRE